MKIHWNDIPERYQLEILGNESWLEGICGDFLIPSSKVIPRLTGTLVFEKSLLYQNVLVKGKIQYNPFVKCSRCADPVQWKISCDISALYMDRLNQSQPDQKVTIDGEEVEPYSFKEQCIDLEELINEHVQMAIPLNTMRLKESSQDCLFCGENVEDPLVYKDSDQCHNPFAILSKLT